MNGIEVLAQLRAIETQAGVIVLTGGGSLALENRAWEPGATDFLNKGLSLSLELQAATAERAGLKISSKLLKLGRVAHE